MTAILVHFRVYRYIFRVSNSLIFNFVFFSCFFSFRWEGGVERGRGGWVGRGGQFLQEKI